MPVKFKFYEHMPTALTGSTGIEISDNIESDGTVALSEVHMMYDAGGNRVLKTEYVPVGR